MSFVSKRFIENNMSVNLASVEMPAPGINKKKFIKRMKKYLFRNNNIPTFERPRFDLYTPCGRFGLTGGDQTNL